MAKNENVTKIRVGLNAVAVIGIILGLLLKMPAVIISLIVPAVAYEIYSAEGDDKSFTSWMLLALLIAELVAISFNIRANIAHSIGITNRKTVKLVNTFGRLDFLLLLAIAYFSFKFFFKAAGMHAKWLAVLIFAGALASIQSVDPTIHQKLVDFFVNQILGKIKFLVKLLGL